MAVIDNLIRVKPAASCLTLEMQTVSQKNRPFQWLSILSENEKLQIPERARKIAPEMKEMFKNREMKISEQIAKRLQAKREKVEMKEIKEMNIKTKYTNELIELGGVWSIADIDEEIGNIEGGDRDKRIHSALLSQIKLHKVVLNSKGPRYLYQEQVKGKNIRLKS